MDEQLLLDIKKNIFNRAKIFIEEIGSFAPFAATYDGKTIKDLTGYEDFEDSIEGIKLINLLKGSITKELNQNLILAGAIAYDVTIELENGDGLLEKRDALCLIITSNGESWDEEYFPYMVIESQCIWK